MVKPFEECLRWLGDEDAFLAKHPHPALLLEPFAESISEGIDTPPPTASGSTPDLGQTHIDILFPDDGWARPAGSQLVHPDAQVAWLVKTDRNPFVGMITLGRARNNDIILRHPTISKMHAIFYEVGRRWLVEDRKSTNGTFLGGVRLPAQERRGLNDGDQLRLADAIVATFFRPESFWAFCRLACGSSSDLQPIRA